MYRQQEIATFKRKFWTSFGLYMKPVPSVWHPKVNWLNYKTGIKDVFFRMDADTQKARIGIVLAHSDPLMRQMFYDHFAAMKSLLHDTLGEAWNWESAFVDETGKTRCRISHTLYEVNIMDTNCWPACIAFFKPRIIALDTFWGDVKDSMDGL